MNRSIARISVAVLALLCAAMGNAATVTLTATCSASASCAEVQTGDTFSILMSGSGFPDTAGASLTLQFDGDVASIISPSSTNGIVVAPGSPFAPGVITQNPTFTPGDTFSFLAPTTGALPSGSFDAVVFNFIATGPGLLNLSIFDDGLDNSWTDGVTFEAIPVTYDYTNAEVTVTADAGVPDIVVTDSVPAPDDGSVPFGDITQGQTSTQTVTVTNSGTGALNIGQVAGLAAPFTLGTDTCSNQAIAALASCTIQLQFQPVATGPFSDTLNIPSDDPDTATATVDVTGNGVTQPTPNIGVDDSDVLFGDITQGQTITQTVTVTNSGSAVLNIGQVAGLAAPFSLGTDTCSNQAIAALATCTIQVHFQPVAAGPFDSSLTIPSDDPDTATVTVTVSGNGVALSVPNIVVTDSVVPNDNLIIPFGSVTQGGSSTETVTVTNSGSGPLNVGQVAGLVAPFSLGTDTCSNQAIAAAATCTIQVLFNPVAIGPFSSSLNIPSNDAETPTVAVSVSGTGTASATPNVVVTDSVAPVNDLSVPFANVTNGTTSTKTVTVTNNGDANLAVGAVATANPLAAPFVVANDTCSNQSVLPAGSCTFDVQFQPTVTGPSSDSLDIPSNDPDMPTVTVNVSGTGTDLTGPAITVTDSISPADDLQMDFSNVFILSASEATVTVTNSGVANLVIGTIGGANALAAPFSVSAPADQCSGHTLIPGASCTVLLIFGPTAVGVFSDSFDIPSNDPVNPTVTVAVAGTGIPIQNLGGGSSAIDLWSLALLAGLPLARRRRK